MSARSQIDDNGERIARLEADNVNIKLLLVDIKKAIIDGFDKWSKELKEEHKQDLRGLYLKLEETEARLKHMIDTHTAELEDLFIVRFFTRNPKMLIMLVVGMISLYLLTFSPIQKMLIQAIL